MPRPLEGVKVLDLTRLLPGAICTMLLVDMGAEVIKLEDTGMGDYSRWMPPILGKQGAFFQASNRNKKSIVLDLKQAEAQAILHELIKTTDIFIEGFRPNVTARLGADEHTLRQINPKLVYCSLSGWGQTGDYAEVSGHDLNYVALSGLLGGMATPQVLGGQIADVCGAYIGAMGICASLFARERTGRGAYLDVALFESALPLSMYQWVEGYTTGAKGGQGTLTGGNAFYRVYISQDGQPMALSPIEDKFWANFCNAVQHPEWLGWNTRVDKQEELLHILTVLFASQPAQHWFNLLEGADCCFTHITPPEELHNDPHIISRDLASIAPDGVPIMKSPLHLENIDEPLDYVRAPHYGEHTEEVLLEIGYSEAQIEAWHTRRIVRMS